VTTVRFGATLDRANQAVNSLSVSEGAAECAMPRYFFDVQSRSGLVCRDYQGLDCPNDEAARSLAQHGAGFTSLGDCSRNPQLQSYRFSVADAGHKLLFMVPFCELLPEDEPPPTVNKQRPRAMAGKAQSDQPV
jgi:hypothetical protein